MAFLAGLLKVWGFKMLFYVGILAGVASYTLVLHSRVKRLEIEAAGLRRDRAELIEGTKSLQEAITLQNEAVEKWQREAAKQEVEVRKAQVEALGIRKAYAKRSLEILHTPVPRECEKAVEWLAGKAQEQAQWR